jgi:phosphate-selective porin
MGLPRFPIVCLAADLALILACACPARAGEDAPAAPPRFAPVLGAYVQVRFGDQGRDVGEWAVRRLKLMVDGGPNDGIRYHVQFIYKTNLHSSTDDRVVLQDAFLVVPAKRLSVKVGQFIPPFGLERFQPDATLPFTERSQVTNQLVVNGNLGSSFARDRGAEVSLAHAGWAVTGGLFQGAGANMPAKGNGPLGVFRCTFGHTGQVGRAPWSARAGLAGSGRRDREMDLRGALPGLDSTLVSRFAGGDRRINGFIEGRVGRWRAQAEFFRAWLSPDQGSAWAAQGAYAQVSLLLFAGAAIGTRHEVFTSDVQRSDVPASRPWNVAMTYALPKVPIRLWADYARRNGGARSSGHTWTLQVQWYAFRGLRLWR